MFNYVTNKTEPGRYYKEEMQLVPKPFITENPKVVRGPVTEQEKEPPNKVLLRKRQDINYKQTKTNKKK